MKSRHKLQSTTHHIQRQQSKLDETEKQDVVYTITSKLVHIYSTLLQTPVFFMNANAPPPQEPNKNKTKNMNKKKQKQKRK